MRKNTYLTHNMKAIFLDLDGTLLNKDKQVTTGNMEAIKGALADGHKVIISTGRPTVSALKQAKVLGLDAPGCYVVSYNGGEIVDAGTNESVFRQTIPMEWVRDLFAEAKKRGIHIQTYTNTGVVVEPWCDDADIRRYSQGTLTPFSVIESVEKLENEPVKILALDMAGRDATEPFRQWILEKYAGRLDSFFSNPYYLEVVCAGLNKGSALVRLREILGISKSDTIAAGDASNDIPMILEAGVGVAMINAAPDVLAAADYITEHDNNNDGIAEVIDKFV